MPGTTSTALPSFSHDQHRKTDAAKRKRGHRHTKPPPVALVLMGLSRALRRRSFPHWHPCSSQTAASPMCFGNYRACCCSYYRINTLHIAQLSISLAHERSSENSHHRMNAPARGQFCLTTQFSTATLGQAVYHLS